MIFPEKKVKVPLNITKELSNGQKVIIPNPEYLYLQKEYYQLIKDIPRENEEEFIGGMPVQLEKGCLKELIKQGNYVMTLKVDGERFLLFLSSNGILYFIDRSMNFYYLMNDDNTDRMRPLNVPPFLFDGELVKHAEVIENKKVKFPESMEYLIFDCLCFDNKSFVNETYNIRYDICKHALKNVFKRYLKRSTKLFEISLKVWYNLYTINLTDDIYSFISKETNKGRNLKLKADGLILQPWNTSYIPYGPWNRYNNVQFKWKPCNELTIDFKIKVAGPNEWNLLTKTDQVYMINQENGNPLPATCIPTDLQKTKFFENDVVEFKYKQTGNPNGNLFTPSRLRNEKEANGLSTIKSTICVIKDPFTLDLLKPAIKFLNSKSETITKDAKNYLNLFSSSDLILSITSMFFTKYEIKQIKSVYDIYTQQEIPVELEFRLFKHGKAGKDIDKFTFYYLQDFLAKYFAFNITDTIDIIENKNDVRKRRSTYKNMNDVKAGKSIVNEYKNKIKNYTMEPRHEKKKFYNNLTLRVEVSNEIPTNAVIHLRSQFAGKSVNNLIRVKNRYTFQINRLWKVDLTKVLSGYTLETLEDKNEKFECECEYTGDKTIPFEIFLDSMNKLYKLLISNSNYCETCV